MLNLAVIYLSIKSRHSYFVIQEFLRDDFQTFLQEMQALALFMAGYSQGEIIACFRDAFHRYDSLAGRGGDNIRRYATRSQLLLAEYCCKQSHYSEANAALMRAQSQVISS